VSADTKAALRAKLRQAVCFASRFYQLLSAFLADRLRTTTGSIGSEGRQLSEEVEDVDELAGHLMANISMAGLRFTDVQRGRWGGANDRR